MGNQIENQKEFLYATLTNLETRRTAVDTRTTVVLAFSTVFLGLMFSQLKSGEFLYHNGNVIYKILQFLIILIFSISCFSSLLLISPIKRPKKIRKKVRFSLSFFYLIANQSHEEYYEEVNNLSINSINKELAKQVVEISKLLKKRYKRLKTTCNLLYIGIALTIIYSFLKIII